MTTPDLAALRALVEAVESYLGPVPQSLLAIHDRWQRLVNAVSAAHAALERVEKMASLVDADRMQLARKLDDAEARLAAVRGTT